MLVKGLIAIIYIYDHFEYIYLNGKDLMVFLLIG